MVFHVRMGPLRLFIALDLINKKKKEKEMILNMTQHVASTEQLVNFSVHEPRGAQKDRVIKLLTFDELPTMNEIKNRAVALAEIADIECLKDNNGERFAMIGGAPFLMSVLEKELRERNIFPLYAFSKRASFDVRNDSGEVTKTSVFRHVGFVGV